MCILFHLQVPPKMASDLTIYDIFKWHTSVFSFNVIIASGHNRNRVFLQLLLGAPPPHCIMISLSNFHSSPGS